MLSTTDRTSLAVLLGYQQYMYSTRISLSPRNLPTMICAASFFPKGQHLSLPRDHLLELIFTIIPYSSPLLRDVCCLGYFRRDRSVENWVQSSVRDVGWYSRAEQNIEAARSSFPCSEGSYLVASSSRRRRRSGGSFSQLLLSAL